MGRMKQRGEKIKARNLSKCTTELQTMATLGREIIKADLLHI